MSSAIRLAGRRSPVAEEDIGPFFLLLREVERDVAFLGNLGE